jgi:hypothetical protein
MLGVEALAMGAWMIGRRIPSRSQRGVCNFAIFPLLSALVSGHFMDEKRRFLAFASFIGAAAAAD